MTWISNGNNISCHGASDGQVEAVIVGGTAPYIYSWNNGSFTKKITGLAAGTYTFTVTDANNVTTVAEVKMLEPDALILYISNSDYQGYNISEQGGNDGWVEVKTIGGTPDYAISWTGGGTKERLENLSAGTYSVTVSDRNGCSTAASRTLSEPTPLHVVSITSPGHHGFNVSCKEGKDGAINLSVTGGVAPYTYDWNDGSFAKDRVELVAGQYTVHITDKNDANLEATIQISEPSGLAVTLTPQVYPNGLNLSCHDCANGSMTASGTGGVTPYTYLWNSGQTSGTISGLSDREYGCKITDGNGCIESQALSLYAPDRDDWSMNGNANIDPATQFMGTTDSKDFVFKTNNLERLRIGAGGNISVSTNLSAPRLNINDKITFGGVHSIEYQASYGGAPAKMSFGHPSTTSIISCISPGLNVNPNYQFNGTIQLWQNSIDGVNLNVLEMGHDGANAIIDATGTSTDPLLNRLLINYYCGRDVFVGNTTSGDLTANRNFFSLGKVGIGTTNIIGCSDCNDYNLFVTKGIRTEKIKVDIAAINGWADFVFDENYKLMSLTALQHFILKNKHLPEIPTESEVKLNGLDIAESQKKLLLKIEELTLYVLELNSENEKLKTQVLEIIEATQPKVKKPLK